VWGEGWGREGRKRQRNGSVRRERSEKRSRKGYTGMETAEKGNRKLEMLQWVTE
jgi:hypothetical protein